MSATLLYRIAAFVFVLFAVGHTYGFLSLRPPSAEGRAVYDAMNTVRFEVGAEFPVFWLAADGALRAGGLDCWSGRVPGRPVNSRAVMAPQALPSPREPGLAPMKSRPRSVLAA
jgi:hypothetical protein